MRIFPRTKNRIRQGLSVLWACSHDWILIVFATSRCTECSPIQSPALSVPQNVSIIFGGATEFIFIMESKKNMKTFYLTTNVFIFEQNLENYSIKSIFCQVTQNMTRHCSLNYLYSTFSVHYSLHQIDLTNQSVQNTTRPYKVWGVNIHRYNVMIYFGLIDEKSI